MKTKKVNQKLVLKKRTVANLNTAEMRYIQGGLVNEVKYKTIEESYCVCTTTCPSETYHCTTTCPSESYNCAAGTPAGE